MRSISRQPSERIRELADDGLEDGRLAGAVRADERDDPAALYREVFAIQLERILAFFFQSRVVTPQVPVTALNSLFFFFLALTHTGFQTVVDTWSVSDDQ